MAIGGMRRARWPLCPTSEYSHECPGTLEGGVSREYLLHHRVCPTVITEDGSLVVAVAPDALVPEALDDLGLAWHRPIVSN